jgi:xylulokinase
LLCLGIDSGTKVDSKGEIAAFCDGADRWLPLSCTMNVAVTSEQMQELFGWDIRSWRSAGVSHAADGWCPTVVGPFIAEMLQKSSS